MCVLVPFILNHEWGVSLQTKASRVCLCQPGCNEKGLELQKQRCGEADAPESPYSSNVQLFVSCSSQPKLGIWFGPFCALNKFRI